MSEITKNRLTDRKRASIIEAAIEVFSTNGFDHAKMDRIAEVAEVSKRTVYNHFPSKELLFEEIQARLREAAQASKKVEYSKDKPLDEQLFNVGLAYAKLLSDDDFQKMCRIAMSRCVQFPEYGKSTLEDCAKLVEGIAQWIEAAKADGRLDFENTEDTANLFSALITEFAFWPQMISHTPRLTTRKMKKVVSTAVTIFLGHYST